MSMRGFVVTLLPFAAACYRYAPVDTHALQPGMSVRARVTGATAEQIEPLLGMSDARLLNGRIITADADALIVEVPAVYRAEIGSSIQTLHQRVTIPRSGLLEMETRTLDRFKTTIVAGAAAAVLGAYILKSTVLDPGKEGLPPGGGGPELTVRIFSGWP